MKKVVISLMVLVAFIFLVGCLDYKAYDVPAGEDNSDEIDLINEIAEIEKQLEEEEADLEDEDVVAEDLELEDEIIEEIELEEEEVTEKEIVVKDDDSKIIQVKENELVKLNVKVADPDRDVVTYTFTKPIDQKGEWKTNYGDAGEYLVTLTASDGQLETKQKIKIVVERVNVAPVIKPLRDIVVKEGEEIKFEPEVSDPNNDPVSITVSEPLKSGVFHTDHTSAGEYQIKVLASDGELETERSFKLIVNDINVLPEVKGLKNLDVKEGETVKIEPDVSDLDGDDVTVTISEPVGDDGIWETSFTDHGDYVITVIVDDGKDKVNRKVKVTVEDVNMPPEIVDVSLDLN